MLKKESKEFLSQGSRNSAQNWIPEPFLYELLMQTRTTLNSVCTTVIISQLVPSRNSLFPPPSHKITSNKGYMFYSLCHVEFVIIWKNKFCKRFRKVFRWLLVIFMVRADINNVTPGTLHSSSVNCLVSSTPSHLVSVLRYEINKPGKINIAMLWMAKTRKYEGK
jgi:hypothetical protein